MTENHRRENTRRVNGKADSEPEFTPRQTWFLWLFGIVTDWLREFFPVPPRVTPGTVMLRKDVMRNMQIDDDTFVRWRDAGLQTCRTLGTRNEVVLTDNLIRFIATNPDLTAKGRKAG